MGSDQLQPIFVGDIQGCGEELALVLKRAEGEFGDAFHLHVVGDLVNRGPANLVALEHVRRLVEAGRCTYVLGNHEINFLRVAFGLSAGSERDTLAEVLESDDADDWIEWIRRRPILFRGELGERPYVMVHAALHPEVDVETQAEHARQIEARLGAEAVDDAVAFLGSDDIPDAREPRDWLARFTRCRSVSGDAWSSEEPLGDFEPWHAAWLRAAHRHGVVYGHWALQGLHVVEGLRGLDSGCVHHGRGRDGFLTAWLPSPAAAKASGRDPFATPDAAFWQIPALRHYYPY